MEKSELKLKKSSCCVTAFYSLFEERIVGGYYVNTFYLDILAWIELKIDISSTFLDLPKKTTKN